MLNNINIMGRLTKDPDVRRTTTGKSVTSFTLAVGRDINKEETDYIDIVTWNGTADFAGKYLAKGMMIVASGRLQFRDWTDKDGNNRRSAEVVASNIYFAESKKTDTGSQNAVNVSMDDLADDDFPF